LNRSSKRFQRVKASVKLGVEAMQKLKVIHAVNKTVECHNCHAENERKRCFCRVCKARLIHSYG